MGYGFGKIDKSALDKSRLKKVDAKERGTVADDQQEYVATVRFPSSSSSSF